MALLWTELNNQCEGAGEKWAALLLARDSLQHLESANTTVSLKAVWWDAQIIYELEIDCSALEKSIWKQWSISGKLHWFVMLHFLLPLGRWVILLCTFWATELGTAHTQCWLCPAHLTCTVRFASKQLRGLCNNNLYSSKSPGINNYEFSSVVKMNLTAYK